MRKQINSTLTKEASLALSGAEYVRQKLNALAGIGPSSLYSQVYAIKFRVKSLDSLVNKCRDRQKRNKKYKPGDATDLVGMRLLSIYAADLPNAVQAVLQFIKFCQSPEVQLMQGKSFDDAITEVKVYKSTRNAIIYDSIYQRLVALKLSQTNEKGEIKCQMVVEKESSKSYSSIHILCNCLSYSAGTSKLIPLEIQIRTIFEDAWGEIDHQLQYKLKQKGSVTFPQSLAAFQKNYKKMLDNLKDKLEIAGNDAEDIREGYNQLYKAISGKSRAKDAPFKLRDIYMGDSYGRRLKRIVDKAPSLRDSVDELIALYSQIESKIGKDITSSDDFKKLNAQIEKYMDMLVKLEVGNKKVSSVLSYFKNMECALCLMWQGIFIAHFEPESVERYLDKFKKSRDLYLELEQQKSFRSHPFLLFRLAVVLELLGNNDVSEMFLNKSIENLGDFTDVENPSFFMLIPHLKSVRNWERRCKLLEVGLESGIRRINRNQQMALMEEALYFGLYGFINILSSEHQLRQSGYYDDLMFKSANNIVSYGWEMRDLCHSSKEFYNRMQDILAELKSNGHGDVVFDLHLFGKCVLDKLDHEPKNCFVIDTAMKYHHLIGDRNRSTALASNLDTVRKNSANVGALENVMLKYSIEQVQANDDYSVADIIKHG